MITTDFYNLLLSDTALAAMLLVLFCYVSHVSHGVRGIRTWGVAHFIYSLGAAMLDGTSQTSALAGHAGAASNTAAIGGLLASTGMAGLAWAVIRFTGQRHLRPWEAALVPAAAVASLLVWAVFDSTDAQGTLMSVVEVVALLIMLQHLAGLRDSPDRLPARIMMAASVVLLGLYGRDAYYGIRGLYAPNPEWVNIDLSLWFLLNFCMLMLTSFHAAQSLRHSAMYDPLTGALNRRGLATAMEQASSSTLQRGFAVVALDLDHFKSINDQHGHDTGDVVLRRFSEVVRNNIRGGDIFVRHGGDEFVLLLRGVNHDDARQIAERIRLQTLSLSFNGTAALRASVSVGISYSTSQATAMETLMRDADRALYVAKQKGRNQVEILATKT